MRPGVRSGSLNQSKMTVAHRNKAAASPAAHISVLPLGVPDGVVELTIFATLRSSSGSIKKNHRYPVRV